MHWLAHFGYQVEPDLNLLLEVGTSTDRERTHRVAIFSAILHVFIFFLLPFVPVTGGPERVQPRQTVARKVTPLIAPPFELTQKTPNRAKVSKEIDLESLRPRPPVMEPPRTRPPVAMAPPKPAPTAVPAPVLPAPPKIELPPTETATLPPIGTGNSALPPAPTPTPAAEKPKLAFESVSGAGMSTGNQQGTPGGKLQVPKSGLEEVTQGVARGRRPGVVVGDNLDDPGISPGLQQSPLPGRPGSSLELLSDPRGVDFRPYLIKILSAVRRNWFAVMPESAKLGRRGRVIIQFAISRDGGVPKLVIATPSGAEALDRAAVAGISASNPFPPLPPEFDGPQIRLQLAFSYNMPAK